MRTCRFFTASQKLNERYPGMEPADDYEYDRPFHFSNCSCDAVTGGAPFAACQFEGDFSACGYYSAEQLRPVKSVVVTREDAEIPVLREERLRLGMRRVQWGLPEYHVTVETLADTETGAWSTPVVLHTISGSVHGPSTKSVAEGLYAQELEKERASYPYKEAPLSDAEPISYVETVVTT